LWIYEEIYVHSYFLSWASFLKLKRDDDARPEPEPQPVLEPVLEPVLDPG
jgi:hypothetical protein